MAKTIRITLTDAEEQELAVDAAIYGTTIARLVHARATSSDTLLETIREQGLDYQCRKQIRIDIPMKLLEELKADARYYGYPLSGYITYLLAQKGKPVMVEYKGSDFLAEYTRAINNINALAQDAYRHGINANHIRPAAVAVGAMYEEVKQAHLSMNKLNNRAVLDAVRELIRKEKESPTKS